MMKTKIPIWALALLLLPCSMVEAQLIDFSGLGNGQKISGTEASPLFNVSSSGPNLGAAIFDSDPAGPNATADDTDLLVDQGNILILQCDCRPEDFGGSDFFELPDDSPGGGTISFDFVSPVSLSAIDVVDIDTSGVGLTLTDGGGLTRSYTVPTEWTGDGAFATLDLTTLANQAGAGAGDATATEDVGFDPTNVVTLDTVFAGSGALNNLSIVPEPTSVMLLLSALATLLLHRQR